MGRKNKNKNYYPSKDVLVILGNIEKEDIDKLKDIKKQVPKTANYYFLPEREGEEIKNIARYLTDIFSQIYVRERGQTEGALERQWMSFKRMIVGEKVEKVYIWTSNGTKKSQMKSFCDLLNGQEKYRGHYCRAVYLWGLQTVNDIFDYSKLEIIVI